MKKLLLTLCVLVAPACVSDPVDASLSYLQSDLDSYEVVAPTMEALLDAEIERQPVDRALNPWSGTPFTVGELEAMYLVLDSWKLRLEGAGLEVD